MRIVNLAFHSGDNLPGSPHGTHGEIAAQAGNLPHKIKRWGESVGSDIAQICKTRATTSRQLSE
jgi:hypothetical protein